MVGVVDLGGARRLWPPPSPPASVERLRGLAGARPFRTFWIGFLTVSALIGASILAVLSVIGILAAPAVVLVAVALGFVGYILAIYLVGRAIWGWLGQLPPDTLPERAPRRPARRRRRQPDRPRSPSPAGCCC